MTASPASPDVKARSIRDQSVLQHIKTEGWGLEIGPCHVPVAPKSAGFNVHVLDHADQDGLREKYADHNLALDQIEEVDHVWNGESYAEIIGQEHFYDWIIASHVIEHTPDLVDFLLNCDQVLRPDGVLSLAVPDKRYCFDHFRPNTSLGSIVDAHESRHTCHSKGALIDSLANTVSIQDRIIFDPAEAHVSNLIHTPSQVLEVLDHYEGREDELDIHRWCFTPSWFRVVIQDLFELEYQPFREVGFERHGGEFHIALSREGKGPDLSRFELLQLMQKELSLGPVWSSSPAVQRSLMAYRRARSLPRRLLNLVSR